LKPLSRFIEVLRDALAFVEHIHQVRLSINIALFMWLWTAL
jgi:hypothetical protein